MGDALCMSISCAVCCMGLTTNEINNNNRFKTKHLIGRYLILLRERNICIYNSTRMCIIKMLTHLASYTSKILAWLPLILVKCYHA